MDSVVIKQHQARVITSNNDEDVQHVSCLIHYSSLVESLLMFQGCSSSTSLERKLYMWIWGGLVESFSLKNFQLQYFTGYLDHVIPLHNVEAVVDNRFCTFGKMIVTSIIQGGEVPVCFAKPVADYIVNKEVSSPTTSMTFLIMMSRIVYPRYIPCLKGFILIYYRLFQQSALSNCKKF